MSNGPSQNASYSATLTGNPFLFFETRIVAEKIMKGLGKDSIQKEIQGRNLFQYRSTKSIPKRVNAILRRISDLDPRILKRLADGSAVEARTIVLLAITRSDRLFREFLSEVVHEKMHSWDGILKDSDLERFFELKRETGSKVAGWSEDGFKKLKQVYLNILVASGVLKDRKERKISKALLSPDFKKILFLSFSPDLIRMIEG